MPTSRRDFLQTASALAAAGFLPRPLPARSLPVDASPAGFRARPCVVASANGLRGVQVAWDRIVAGEDPLDGIIAGVNIQELDPEDQSVGLGGLPNAEGVVQLDASCMHGPTRRAGAVACLEDIATPSLVAKAVMDYTDHVLLAGPQARRFALELGFTPQNLLTEKSRQDWLRWRARLNPNDMYLDYDGDIALKFHTGTINMNAVTAGGDIASVTTTSGMAWKVPGRVGDSPIIGAGLYVDDLAGAGGATGVGEEAVRIAAAHVIVEALRSGRSAQAAAEAAVARINEVAARRKRPPAHIAFIALSPAGEVGAAATRGTGFEYAVARPEGIRLTIAPEL